MFTVAEAGRIVDVRPDVVGWTWPKKAEKSVSSGPGTSDSTDPIFLAFRRQTAGIKDLGGAVSKLQDDDKLAHLDIGVYRSSADAHRVLAPFNALSRGYAKRFGGIVKDEEVHGLGDEAWRLWATGNGAEVTYHWRRANLLLEAHVHCFGNCPRDFRSVDAADRAWADAIDKAARSLG